MSTATSRHPIARPRWTASRPVSLALALLTGLLTIPRASAQQAVELYTQGRAAMEGGQAARAHQLFVQAHGAGKEQQPAWLAGVAYYAATSAEQWKARAFTEGELCNWGKAGRKQHPMNCVDWIQAEAFCRAAGARLPTEAEWEYAARGPEGRPYPWGGDAPEARGRQPGNFADETAGRTFKGLSFIEGYDDGFAGTSPVGSFGSGAPPQRLQDMAGNVWEWVGDWYDAGYYSKSPGTDPVGPTGGAFRVRRGGSFASLEIVLRAAERKRDAPTYRHADLGLRCARSDHP